MKITIIICTHNRCGSLSKALDSVAKSNLPGSTGWEVLVVDNNSSDQTAEVVKGFCAQYPQRFRYLFEPQQGKSYALNSAVREAAGEVVAFMDDDVLVDSNWVQNLTHPLLSDKWVGSGGRILPQEPFSLPAWFPRNDKTALASLALLDLGPEAGPLYEPPFGTNMAFKRNVFEKYGLFRTDLGPLSTSKIQGEDSEFVRRLLNAKEPIYYQPAAVVYHEMHPHRLTQEYLLAWSFAKGRSEKVELGTSLNTKWFVGGIPLRVFRSLLVWTLRWMFGLNAAKRFYCRYKVWWLAGLIFECRSQSVAAKKHRNILVHL